jgi:NADPH-ferrihemoprotein reductase
MSESLKLVGNLIFCSLAQRSGNTNPPHFPPSTVTTMSKMNDFNSLAGLKSILQHSQKDDVAFLVFLLFSCIFYKFIFKDKPDPYRHLWFEKPQATDANAKCAATRNIGQKLEETVSGSLINHNAPSLNHPTAQGYCDFVGFSIRHR